MSQRQKKIRFKLRYLNLRIIIHKAGSKEISNVQKKKKKKTIQHANIIIVQANLHMHLYLCRSYKKYYCRIHIAFVRKIELYSFLTDSRSRLISFSVYTFEQTYHVYNSNILDTLCYKWFDSLNIFVLLFFFFFFFTIFIL